MPAVLEGTGGKEVSLEDATRFGLKAEAGDELVFQIFYRREGSGEGRGAGRPVRRPAQAEDRAGRASAASPRRPPSRSSSSASATPSARTSSTSTRTARASSSPASSAASSAATSSSTWAAPRRCCRCASRCRARRTAPATASSGLRARHRQERARARRSSCRARTRACSRSCSRWRSRRSTRGIVRIEASAREPGGAREDRRQLARSRRRPGRRLRRHEGLARPGGRAGAARREDRHRPLRRRSGALRVQRASPRPRSPASSSTTAATRMELIVPDDQLSLAIGQKGQNVRLASQLTGWSIDIHSESKVREMEARARQSLAAIKSGPDGGGLAPATVEALFQAGWRSAAEVSAGKPDELASIAGIGGAAGAQAVIAAAASAAELERERHAEEAARGRRGQGSGRAGREGAAATAAAAEKARQPGGAPGMMVATEIVHGCAHPDLHRVPTAGCRGRDGAVAVAGAARTATGRRTGRGRGRRILNGTRRLAARAAGLPGHGAAAGCALPRLQAAGDGSRHNGIAATDHYCLA